MIEVALLLATTLCQYERNINGVHICIEERVHRRRGGETQVYRTPARFVRNVSSKKKATLRDRYQGLRRFRHNDTRTTRQRRRDARITDRVDSRRLIRFQRVITPTYYGDE